MLPMSGERRNTLGFEILANLIGAFGPFLINLLFSTCRITVVNRRVVQEYVDGKRPIIGIGWHKYFLFQAWYFQRRRCHVMVSLSRDGEIVTRVLRRWGFVPIRGSSSRGGREALAKMTRKLKEGAFCGIICDGPKGPPNVTKIGCVLAARDAGAPIGTFAVSAKPILELKNWDRTAIPLPFSRITVKLGEPLLIPQETSQDELEGFRLQLERMMHELDRELREITGQDGVDPGIGPRI